MDYTARAASPARTWPMFTKLLLLVLVLGAVTCKSSREPLPHLEAPPHLGSRVESLYIWAHYRPLIRSLMAREDIRFDKDLQFHHHHFWVLADLRRGGTRPRSARPGSMST